MRRKSLRKRQLKPSSNDEESKYIVPRKKRGGNSYSKTVDYKYFEEHVVPEIVKQLSENTIVICWNSDHMLSLPTCAIRKFWKQHTCCKRCSLFQEDRHAQVLISCIEEWEKDDIDAEE